MNSEEQKLKDTTASNWHPNAPLNPQTEESQGPASTIQAESPTSRPESEEPNTQVVPPVAESDDQDLHKQWSAAGGASPESHH